MPYQIMPRRAGGITTCYAKADKSKQQQQGWSTTRTLEEMCESSWKLQCKQQ